MKQRDLTKQLDSIVEPYQLPLYQSGIRVRGRRVRSKMSYKPLLALECKIYLNDKI